MEFEMKHILEELVLSDMDTTEKVNNIVRTLQFDATTVEKISNVFKKEIEHALNLKPSSLQMENTYITELPDGTENGHFLAMDLGGTNLRVLFLELMHGKVVNERVQHYFIKDSLRIGCGTALFDFLAKCINDFVIECKLDDNVTYPLGFTFSFPMIQNGLDSGILVTWTKSFDCPSIVGADAVQKLNTSLRKCNRNNIEVVAILNDTTGTLIHGAYIDKDTRIGIVLGTGSNGCYWECVNRAEHWKQNLNQKQNVIIDVEWGAFGDNGVLDFIKTDFDRLLDENSLLKKSFTFEKYIGGKYLGELCRIVLKALHEENHFLQNEAECKFAKPWTFDTNYVSLIEEDTLNNTFENSKSILKEYFQSDKFSLNDLKILRHICGLISLRAAQLVAITTSVLLNRLNDTNVTVAIDGSLYKHHPRIGKWISDLTALWAPTKKTKFILAEDGSGKGAALLAAIAVKLQAKS